MFPKVDVGDFEYLVHICAQIAIQIYLFFLWNFRNLNIKLKALKKCWV